MSSPAPATAVTSDPRPEEGSTGGSSHPSSMRSRMNRLAEAVGRRLFGKAVFQEILVERIRELSARGTVVYVLRHRSFVDYFMVNYLLRREGLPLPAFANGISSLALAPLAEIVRTWRRRGRESSAAEADRDACARALADERPVLVFMRGPKEPGAAAAESEAQARVGGEYLRRILGARGDREVFVVPLAPFRGHSFRRRGTGITALVYNAHDVASEWRKLLTYWFFRRDLFLTVGTEVSLADFVERYREDDEDRLVRRLTRAIQIFLYREERVVMGPAIMPRHKIKRLVLGDDETQRFLAAFAQRTGQPEAKVRKRAEAIFDEMAAEYNSAIFAVVAWTFTRIWKRMFQGLEPIGFEKVIEKAKHHPIVLVPCHRSHFDYLILSYLFYSHFVSPPHIAAGINMRFWPMGAIFRASGAFFIRRSFGDDEVYKHVFRRYLQFLIREGYTQEFFIEGGRSRTGKILTPKLGMLSAILSAYAGGIRRDLYLVPVSIHYGRIVEEESYQAELAGGEKEPESMLALVRARRFLKQKYGSIYVSFADPISLNEALGDRKLRFVEKAGDPEVEEEKRRFTQRLGFRILRAVNAAAVAGATSLSSTVLLGSPHWGFRYRDFRERARALYDLITFEGVRPTASLERNAGDFRESISFLGANGLIEVLRRGAEDVLIVKQGRRLALDFYKNNLIHVFLVPSLVVSCLREGVRAGELCDKVWWWLELFRNEFPLPSRADNDLHVARVLEYLAGRGAYVDGELIDSHPLAAALLHVLQNFREAYYVTALALQAGLDADGRSMKSAREDVRRNYKTCLLLGEVVKAEGASDITIGNALSRLTELGYVRQEDRGRGGRERYVWRGPRWEELESFVAALAESLKVHREPARR